MWWVRVLSGGWVEVRPLGGWTLWWSLEGVVRRVGVGCLDGVCGGVWWGVVMVEWVDGGELVLEVVRVLWVVWVVLDCGEVELTVVIIRVVRHVGVVLKVLWNMKGIGGKCGWWWILVVWVRWD